MLHPLASVPSVGTQKVIVQDEVENFSSHKNQILLNISVRNFHSSSALTGKQR